MGTFNYRLSALAFATVVSAGFSRTLEVGPGKPYVMPSAAALAARDGDTVLLAATVYLGDAATWNASNLVIRSVSAFAHIKAAGVNAGGKGTWVIKGNNTTVENIEFSEGAVPDENGAGIRQEGANLTVRRCYFHHNQNGILAGPNAESDILIENSEFAHNGFGDGYTHNMYINQVKSFTLRYCYTHHAKVGHNIKTRALKSFILCNRSFDGSDGTASYELDLPNGGQAVIAGNVFQQGAATDNPTILSYGAENPMHPGSSVQIVNNTFVNDRASGGTFINLAAATPSARVLNNLFVGSGTVISGFKPDSASNLLTQAPAFADRNGFDYRLTPSSPAIDKGKDPGQFDGAPLLPTMQLLPPDILKPRPVMGLPDIGAFEYEGNVGTKAKRPRSGAASFVKDRFLAGHGWLFGGNRAVDGLGREHPGMDRMDSAPL